MSYFVYILECGDGTLYTGIARNLHSRLWHHQNGMAAKYTRGRQPVKLVYQEEYTNRSEASKREYEIKQMPRKRKLELING